MAVYTPVPRPTAERFLQGYDVGSLRHIDGIAAGLANSNYRVETDRGRYVLTLFEDFSGNAVAPLLAFSRYLHQRGLPCPNPLRHCSGHHWRALQNRPATLVPWLPGTSPLQPGTRQARATGSAVGRLHRLGKNYRGPLTRGWGGDWNPSQIGRLRPRLAAQHRVLLQRELTQMQSLPLHRLPSGPIHSDLFRDNTLFQGSRLSGLLDLYDACRGPLLYDLAVTVNDWCSRADGSLDTLNTRALLTGYQSARPLTAAEKTLWPSMLRLAAMRFWVSRLHYRIAARPQTVGRLKDPNEYLAILQQRVIAARHGDRHGL